MKKKLLALMLSISMVLSVLPVAALQAEETAPEVVAAKEATAVQGTEEGELGKNVAPEAKASASYTNVWYISPDAMNDGKLAGSDSSTSWNSWGGSVADYPLSTVLTWEKDYELTGMRVMWWADNPELASSANVTFPKNCYLEYLDSEGVWQKISDVGVEYDASSNNGINGNNKKWNTVIFEQPITTKSLRMIIERNGSGTNGVGISEWEAFGNKEPGEVGEIGTNIAPTASASADHANTPVTNVNDEILSGNDPTSSWNTWKEDGSVSYPTPVLLEWEELQTINSMEVLWWADNSNVKFPGSCAVSYYDEKSSKWVDITDMVNEDKENVNSVGVKFTDDGFDGENQYWNGVVFKSPIKTRKLRLQVERMEADKGSVGIGISEWKVYGEEVKFSIGDGLNIAPSAAAEAEHSNTPVKNVNNGALASGADTSWNTWSNPGKYPTPVTLKWEDPYEISSMQVMYWADTATLNSSGGVSFPKSCNVQYLDNLTGEWVTATNLQNEAEEAVSSVGVKYTSTNNGLNGDNRYWNGILFKTPIKTTQLRLLIDRNGTGSNGIGIGEWQVFGEKITNELFGAKVTGKAKLAEAETAIYTGSAIPGEMSEGADYAWSVAEDSTIEIVGGANEQTVSVRGNEIGTGFLTLQVSNGDVSKETSFAIRVEGIESVDTYKTATAAGKAPILPAMTVVNGISFDDETPSLKSTTKPDFDFAETFNSKLMPVVWEEVNPLSYGSDQVGNTFIVKGYIEYDGEQVEAAAEVTVQEPSIEAVANSTVTFENIQLTDNFWLPKQKTNAMSSLNAAIDKIGQASGGEPNFDNAIKKLNGEPYEDFQGFVFQDSDIYKSIEAISYTLSATQNDRDPEMIAQREKLQTQVDEWIGKIEKVQYADGYIDTFFTLRSDSHAGGSSPGTHRYRDMSNHEMYNAGHFLESVVAYTRYREGINSPDYRLYVVGKRFADDIVSRFGPGGTRHEVPGHEEVELALVKLGKLVEQYEGTGTGQKYFDTAKLLIDRRGESASLRESGYKGGDYSQDARPFVNEKNGVGHAVRANYLYAGATDVATLLKDGDEDKTAYLNTLDTIWESVANRKTYITGGIGVSTHGEDFGNDYELPNDKSYCETCAAIALANWNQRMNLVHEDAKYADIVEKTLYNAILVGTNLDGNLFYYSSLLEASRGNPRSSWFACACCPPNLMRTIASLSGYMYTVHKNDVFVNMYIESEGKVNVGGTEVSLNQETNYPWNGSVKLSVDPAETKEFTLKIRIPGWVKEQKNNTVEIKVNGEAVTAPAQKGYVAITKTWEKGDVVTIDIPMEIRMTEANPKVTTNTGKVALERGPIVYCMEKAGNAQLNSDISDFSPLKFVIPRDAELKAEYKSDLLKGVVEITGDVSYHTGSSLVPAKLQAVPYYSWNNRGDDGVYGQNKSSQMLIWTNAAGDVVLHPSVQNAMTLIDAIGTVAATESCKEKITAARAAYDGLTNEQRALVTNSDTLIDAEAAYNKLIEAVEKTKELIDAIGLVNVTDECKTKIDAARGLYDPLSPEQKALVTNYKDLTSAEKEYEKQLEAVQKTIEAIEGIGTVTVTSTCKVKIDAARRLYDPLSAEQKSLITNIKVLTDAEAEYGKQQQAIQKTIEAINQIGTVTASSSCKAKIDAARALYASLSADQKALVTNIKVLTDAETEYAHLTEAVQKTIELIRGIGKVTVSDTSKAKMDEARNSYNVLSTEQKAKVTDLKVLIDAEVEYEKQLAEVQKTIELISGIGKVTVIGVSKTKINEARNSYNTLSTEQKEKVTNLKILTDAEVKYAALLAEANKKISLTACKVQTISVQYYNGKAKTPAPGVTYNGKALVLNRDYQVAYQSNVNIGKGKVIITGMGNYSGTITLTFTITVKKGTAYTVGNYNYKIISSSGTASLKGVKIKSVLKKLKKITVPATVKIGGKRFKITEIGANAFKNATAAKSAVIGSNVTNIAGSAFYNCKKLQTITISSTKLNKVGKNAFKNISSKAKIKVPKSKLTKYKKLLKAKGLSSSVKITK